MNHNLFRHSIPLFIFWCILCLFPVYGFSNTGVLDITPSIDRLNLTGYLSYYKDDSGLLDIHRISSEQSDDLFKPLEKKASFGYSSATFWFRFTAKNQTLKPIAWYVEYPYAVIDQFEFFHPDPSGFISYLGGDRYSFSQRPVNYRTLVIPIDLAPGEHTFYFKIKSDGSIVVPLTGWGKASFEHHKNLDLMLNWLYYGVMLATVIYCILIFLSMGELIFFYLGFCISGVTLFTMVHSGIAFQFFWPDSMMWANLCHPISGLMGLIGCLQFTRSFLNTKNRAPAFDKMLLGLVQFNILLFVISSFIPYRFATQSMVLSIGVSAPAMIGCCLFLLLKGLRQAWFYLIAWSPFIVSSILMVFKSYGFLENNLFTDSMVQFSSLFVSILLSFGLIDKLNNFRIDRENALADLHTSEAKYRLLAENVKDVIWILNLKSMKLVYITPSIKGMMGYSPNEAKSFSFNEMLPPESSKKAWKTIKESIRNSAQKTDHLEESFTLEMECFHQSGDIIWTETTATFVRDNLGDPIEMIGVTRDVTERKQAEKEKKLLEFQLHQSSKIEAIGTLAGGIAHDMNNIIAGILGYTELSIREADKESRMHHRLDRIIKACHRARDLVSQILTFSRQDNQELKTLRIHMVVKEVLKLIRASLPTTVSIRTSIQDESLLIDADPTQLHQIIMNLCSNASHAMMENGGTLSISIEKMYVHDRNSDPYLQLEPGDYVRLTVNDTGHGMKKEVMDRIFEPFFTTKPVGSGTGMGLSMVHGIIKKMHGNIIVYSEPRKGTTFHLFFPCTEKPETGIETISSFIPTGNESILYVDDEEYMVDMAQEMLSGLGYRVVVKTSSQEALDYLKQDHEQVDLLITDHTMPGMTGIDLAREIWKIRPGLPVILCSGFNDLVTAESIKDFGISEYILKPFSKQDIAMNIRNVLDKKN